MSTLESHTRLTLLLSHRGWAAMTRISSLTPLTLATLLAGCAFENQFRNVRTGSPHAVLIGDGVTLFHINGQPTSFWRCRERFRIPVGPTTVRTVAGYWDVHDYPLLRFTAEAGHTYSVQRQRTDNFDRVVVRDGASKLIAASEREQKR